MVADGVRCHVRLTPHRFFVHQSLDLDCAIEVVPSKCMLSLEPHVIYVLSESMTVLKTVSTSACVQVCLILITDLALSVIVFSWLTPSIC